MLAPQTGMYCYQMELEYIVIGWNWNQNLMELLCIVVMCFLFVNHVVIIIIINCGYYRIYIDNHQTGLWTVTLAIGRWPCIATCLHGEARSLYCSLTHSETTSC
jgi:hypothetical protein